MEISALIQDSDLLDMSSRRWRHWQKLGTVADCDGQCSIGKKPAEDEGSRTEGGDHNCCLIVIATQ